MSATLYDVTFRPCSPRPTLWHPSVECYEMLGADGGLQGRFYLDMHPRPGKFTHNAAFPIHTGAKGHELPEVALVCNVPNPAKGLGLMSFDAMKTVFHEFGHLLHFLFAGQGRWSRFGGFTIESDFMEAPSMMYEEWMYSWKVLRCGPLCPPAWTLPRVLLQGCFLLLVVADAKHSAQAVAECGRHPVGGGVGGGGSKANKKFGSLKWASNSWPHQVISFLP